MSLDRSLKAANSLIRHRNVLTRAERLVRLAEQEKWNDTKSVYGLPKVGNRKAAIVKSEKAEAGDAAAPAAGAAPAGGKAAAAAPAKGAAGAKGAAPAATGGKAAAAPAAGAKAGGAAKKK
jgi:small basic protein (TIGR04137 family)